MTSMFDPEDFISTFSEEPVQFSKDWEDNSYKMKPPGSRFIGVIDTLGNPKEFLMNGKKCMGFSVSVRSVNPPGVTAQGYLNSNQRDYGNGKSQIEDLIQSTDTEFSDDLTFQGIAEILTEIHREKTEVGFDITWEGYCRDAYEAKLRELTGENTLEAAETEATKDQKKEAKKAQDFYATDFRLNGGSGYSSTTTCPLTKQEVRARYKVRNFLRVKDVEKQLASNSQDR